MKYQWTHGARFRTDAQPIAERIEALRQRHNGTVRPEHLVADAKAKRSPLHDLFQWDDKEAAEQYRLDQARLILRSLTVVVDDRQPEPTRAFLSIDPPADEEGEIPERAYTSVGDAMADPVLRGQVLDAALREIRSWRARYAKLQELARLFEAVDQQLEIDEPVGR